MLSLAKVFDILDEINGVVEDKDKFKDINEVRKCIKLMMEIPKEYRTMKYYQLLQEFIEQYRLLLRVNYIP